MALARLSLLKSAGLLNITGTGSDDVLKAMLIASTAAVQSYCARTLESATYTAERYVGNGTPHLYLLQWPVTAVSAVAIWDGDSTWDTITATHYTLRDSMWLEYAALGYEGAAAYSHWPDGYDIRVTYTAGYTTTNWDTAAITAAALGTVPADLELAVAMHAAYRYNTRSAAGIAAEQTGPVSVSYVNTGGDMPSEIKSLLMPYQRRRL